LGDALTLDKGDFFVFGDFDEDLEKGTVVEEEEDDDDRGDEDLEEDTVAEEAASSSPCGKVPGRNPVQVFG